MELTFKQYKNHLETMSSFLKEEQLLEEVDGFSWSSITPLHFCIQNPFPGRSIVSLFYFNQMSGLIKPVISMSSWFQVEFAAPQDIPSFTKSLIREKEESFSLLVKSGIDSNPSEVSLARMTLIRLSCQVLSGNKQNSLPYFEKEMPIKRVLRAESLKPTTSEEIDVIEALPDSWFEKMFPQTS